MEHREYRALVEHYAALAESPGYHWRVRLWLWLGTLVMISGLVVALACGIGLVALVVASKLWLLLVKGFKLLIPALAALAGFVRSLWIPSEEPPGQPLALDEHPRLHARLEKIAAAVGVPLPERVVLTAELNAAVSSARRFGPLPIYRHTLMLGLPLMEALGPREFDAVVAHELGHLAGGDAAFGSRVYHSRLRWLNMVSTLHERGAGKLALRFVGWYGPRFAAVSHALAQQCEYRADRFGAAATSPRVSMDALTRVQLAGLRADAELWEPLSRGPQTEPRPPKDLLERMAATVGIASEDARAVEWLRALEEVETSAFDTHPALRDRAAALGEEVRVPAPLGKSAARAYLGAKALRRWRKRLSAELYSEMRRPWKAQHRHLSRMRARMEELEAKPASERTRDEQLELVDAYGALDREDAALRMCRQLCARWPEDAELALQHGLALRAVDELDACVTELERAIELEPNPQRELSVSILLLQIHEQRGDKQAFERVQARLEQLFEQERRYQRKLSQLQKKEPLKTATLAPEELTGLRERLQGDRRIKRGWLLARRRTKRGDRPHVLVLEVRVPFLGHERASFTREVIEHHAQGLSLSEPTSVYYYGQQRWLDRCARRTPGALIYDGRLWARAKGE